MYEEELFEAIENNNIEKVKNIVESEVPVVDAECINKALSIATKQKYWELVKYLIEKGADVNTKAEYERETALILASEKENLEMVKYLVEKGASNINDALRIASNKGNLEIVKYLVEKGASNINQALTVALEEKDLELIKYLIEHGANVDYDYDNKVKTALIIASETGNFDMVKYLVEKGADINAFDDWDSISALMMASRFGYLEIVKYLVENGANINAKDYNGWSALMYASTMGYSQIVKYLIEKGANKEEESGNSQEPKLVEKYLFATLKGKIDGKHDITINIQISDVNSLTNGATAELTGNYHYDIFGKNIYFTKGTINKNSMIIEAEGDEFLNFKLDEATLNKILEFKNITINGTWENKSKNFPCVINSVSPLGGKLSEIYKYNISGEASHDRGYGYKQTFEYYGDALYSPSMNVSYFMETFYTFYFDTNVDKVDIKAFKNVMKGNFKKSISDDKNEKSGGSAMSYHYSNDFRIRYFDNKILCLEEYVSSLQSTTYVGYNYTIISLETGKKLNNDFDLYTDLVDYSEEFAEFFKKEFIEYHDYRGHYEERYTTKPSYYKDYYFSTPFIFNNDGTITIYNTNGPSEAERVFRVVKIDMKKLKPYIKKDSFYRYLFD